MNFRDRRGDGGGAHSPAPRLIAGEVTKSEIGVATSLNGILRKVGGAAATALVAAPAIPTGTGFPPGGWIHPRVRPGAATAA